MAGVCDTCGAAAADGPAFCQSCGWGSPAPYAPAQTGNGPRPIEHILAYGYRLDIGAILSEGWRLFTADIGGFIGFTFVGGVIAVLLAFTVVGLGELVVGVINSIGSTIVVGSLITIPLSFCMLVAGYKAVFGLDPRT